MILLAELVCGNPAYEQEPTLRVVNGRPIAAHSYPWLGSVGMVSFWWFPYKYDSIWNSFLSCVYVSPRDKEINVTSSLYFGKSRADQQLPFDRHTLSAFKFFVSTTYH